MEAVERFAADGGPVLGICNGFQVLCEAGLLPGALLPNEGLRFVCRQVELVAGDFDSAVRAPRSRPGSRLSIPVKHMSGRYFAPDDELDRLEAGGQVAFRYAEGHNPNGSVRDIAGVVNEAGNVLGLMPHPEHAVDPLTGSDDGLALFARPPGPPAPAAAVTVVTRTCAANAVALGLTELGVRAHRRADRAATRTGSSWRCSRCCGPSTAPTSTRASCSGKLPTEGDRGS